MQLMFKSVSSLALALFISSMSGAPPAWGEEGQAPLSDGRPITIDEAQMTITPPVGWEILLKSRGKALIMQVPASKEPIKDYSKPIYARNVTVAVAYEPRPIDELEAKALIVKLEKDFGSAPGVRNFQIVEHRLIDYREKADAILVYTAFEYNNFPMSQMHILVSGDKNNALLTYTDLTEAFQKDEAAMAQAWNAMLSINLAGKAPRRYENLIPIGVGLALSLIAGISLVLLRRRNARRFIDAEEENLYSDDTKRSARSSALESLMTGVSEAPVAISDVWSLHQSPRSEHRSKRGKPQTSLTSSEVSNFY